MILSQQILSEQNDIPALFNLEIISHKQFHPSFHILYTNLYTILFLENDNVTATDFLGDNCGKHGVPVSKPNEQLPISTQWQVSKC